eukprot:3937471-Rhodomonas_salina.1
MVRHAFKICERSLFSQGSGFMGSRLSAQDLGLKLAPYPEAVLTYLTHLPYPEQCVGRRPLLYTTRKP